MQKSLFPWYAAVALAVGVLLVAVNVDVVWSTSVDLAHHYALVFRLSENWHFVPDDPTLGEMNVYPRGSHIAAALAGMAFGSPFMGLHVVALGSMALLWMSCLAILYAAPRRTGPLSALVLALLVVLNFGGFRLHGAEISQNYHYAQLVAQALVFVALAAAIRLEGRVHRFGIYLFLLGALLVVMPVHLLPALELLGVLAGLLLLDLVVAPGGTRARLRGVPVAVAVLAAGIAIVVLHPTFATMRAISSHNGGASLGPLGPVWSVGLVSVIVLASVVPLLRAWHRDRATHAMYKYLALYGAAIAGLCLLQMLLRHFNLGSDYAVKKYAYGLATFLFLRLAVWLGGVAARRVEAKPALARLAGARAFQVGVFGLALAATVLGATRMRHELDTVEVVGVERQLLALRTGPFVAAPAGKHNLVLDTGMPPVVDYMFSLTVAHTPRSVGEPAFIVGSDLGLLAQYALLVSAHGHSRFPAAAQCTKAQSESLLVLDAACVAATAGQPGAAVPAAAAP
ncbi:MAG: hypothetical protein AB1584_13915 [Pseudomonadota bacterium]